MKYDTSSSTRVRRFSAACGAGVLAVALALSAPAFAGGKHDGGGTTWTEDNDTNDGGTPNNVADDGDNRHPSGKDRSVERGGSGTQGKSQSDPDGDSNGGPDKPNGSGGVDLADQDGNNGCGNDDDFEDDNNGNCGGREKTGDVTPPLNVGGEVKKEASTAPALAPEVAAVAVTATPVAAASETPASVLGIQIERAATVGGPSETSVLGATLARTGFALSLLAIFGLGLMGAGTGLSRFGRK